MIPEVSVELKQSKKRLGDSYATLNGFFHLYLYRDKVRNLQVTVQTVYAYTRIANVVGHNCLGKCFAENH